MNKTYRTLWNETTQTYVAVAENVKSHGKKSGSLKTVSAAVAAALLTLSAGQAMAADVTVSLGNSPFITQILLGTGDNLIVDTNGVVEIPNSPTTYNHAVKVSLGLIAGSITNSGTILTNNTASHMAVGIYLDNGTLSGIITNSGIIEGGSNGGGYAIGLQSGSQILGGITNSGTLLGGAGIYLDGGSVIHGIANLGGTISGNFSGIAANHASVTADITNSRCDFEDVCRQMQRPEHFV